MSMMLCGETLGVCSFGIVKNIFNGEPCAKWIGIVHLQDCSFARGAGT